MDIKIFPGKLHGELKIIPSKSQAHRLLICAAFSNSKTEILCEDTNKDIEATASCLNALGAEIRRTANGYVVIPVAKIPKFAQLNCGESGSTLRFLLPVICALGVEACIMMEGRLPYRPLSPLWEELECNGAVLTRPTDSSIHVSGKIRPGSYQIPGDVSSQYISGLLFALSLLNGNSSLAITGKLESKPYVDMTLDALRLFGIDIHLPHIVGNHPFKTPGSISVEGDWSNAAFFLAANKLGSDIKVTGLNMSSVQGDRAIEAILHDSSPLPVISAANIPDLVPILSVFFAAKQGVVFTDISRLRLKESDRVATTTSMLDALGIIATSDEYTLTVLGGAIHGGTVDACNDHRIAMAAAIAATVSDAPVTILGAECVAKSYPKFWDEYHRLGGHYEQYIR